MFLCPLFINEEYIDRVLSVLRPEASYARLAVAWAISMCFPILRKGLWSIRASTLDFTLKKAVGKIKESYRVSSEGKQRAVKALAERKK